MGLQWLLGHPGWYCWVAFGFCSGGVLGWGNSGLPGGWRAPHWGLEGVWVLRYLGPVCTIRLQLILFLFVWGFFLGLKLNNALLCLFAFFKWLLVQCVNILRKVIKCCLAHINPTHLCKAHCIYPVKSKLKLLTVPLYKLYICIHILKYVVLLTKYLVSSNGN